jgi:hydrogenase/urease accessory protein HupE
MTAFLRTLALLAAVLVPAASMAHEVRPAYLELREVRADEFAVLWKTPMRGEMRLSLAPVISGNTEIVAPVAARESGGASVQTWRMRTDGSLRGRQLRIQGLESTMTDALARIEFADGTAWLQRLTPQEPMTTIPASQSGWSVAGEYLGLGVEHILLGIDHLLFVLALLIITRGAWRLVKTVTAFTVAHSITLALATLGLVHVPAAPVEALIALSIAFVAAEIVRSRRGRGSLTARAPWIVAFSFGLLHGLGFAGALSDVGLPEGHIPVALLFFNLGVEAGQLMFVGAALCGLAAVRRLRVSLPAWANVAPPYAIGSVAAFWVIQRIAAF